MLIIALLKHTIHFSFMSNAWVDKAEHINKLSFLLFAWIYSVYIDAYLYIDI